MLTTSVNAGRIPAEDTVTNATTGGTAINDASASCMDMRCITQADNNA